jgi:hypothetical protein
MRSKKYKSLEISYNPTRLLFHQTSLLSASTAIHVYDRETMYNMVTMHGHYGPITSLGALGEGVIGTSEMDTSGSGTSELGLS